MYGKVLYEESYYLSGSHVSCLTQWECDILVRGKKNIRFEYVVRTCMHFAEINLNKWKFKKRARILISDKQKSKNKKQKCFFILILWIIISKRFLNTKQYNYNLIRKSYST